MSQTTTDASTAFNAFAAIYDAADMDRSAEQGFYASLLPGRPVSLLELGCGTGTMLQGILARLDAASQDTSRWVGLDSADQMLAQAKVRLPGIAWLQADMRNIPLETSFDWIFCCFHTLQLMLDDQDLLAVFDTVRLHLAPSGRFAFDVYQPNLPYLTRPQPRRVVRTFQDAQGRAMEVHESADYDPAGQILTTHWALHERLPTGAVSEVLARMDVPMRQYFRPTLQALLQQAGLRVVEDYGFYDRRPSAAEAPKQVFVCERVAA